MENYNQNSVMGINAYKDGGMWMFDDERVGLKRELFVSGADRILDDHDFNKSGRVNIAFSKFPFPDRNVKLLMVDTIENGQGGTTYFWPEGDYTVWLCPAMLLFFPTPPLIIYAKLSQK